MRVPADAALTFCKNVVALNDEPENTALLIVLEATEIATVLAPRVPKRPPLTWIFAADANLMPSDLEACIWQSVKLIVLTPDSRIIACVSPVAFVVLHPIQYTRTRSHPEDALTNIGVLGVWKK